MSDPQTASKFKILHKLPIVSIKKDSIQLSPNSKYGMFRCVPGASGSLIKEDIIYKATEGDFLKGKYPDLLIINSLDLAKNSSRTTASYTARDGSIVKLSSDAVVKLIGQDSYDQVFASLCCVINQELKVKGIFSLLCFSGPQQKKISTVYTQTYESSFTDLIKEKQRHKTKHYRRNKVRSYIVQEPKVDVLKKIIIHPDDLKKVEDIKVEGNKVTDETVPISDQSCKDIELEINGKETSCNTYVKKETDNILPDTIFPDIREIVNEDSNISGISSLGNLSIGSNFSLSDLENKAKSLFNLVDDHIEFTEHEHQGAMSSIRMVDGSEVVVRGTPDLFHIAMPDILKDLPPSDQKKLTLHQAYIDWKFCLQRDEDGHLPIHLAALNNDVELLKRQCLILKSRHESVDILGPGNLTALQMSIFQDCPECTKMLLAHGADVMVRDDESRTPLHLAAEIDAKHVDAILTHCRNNAKVILKENEDLWKPELENKPDNKLVDYLLLQLCKMCDNQGYTPLMLASKAGNAAAAALLALVAPSTVNMGMPTSGDTALYLAVGAACTEAVNRGDKTKVPENYVKTIEVLVGHGADPAIENSSGSNVNLLLTEFQESRLSFLIANKLAEYRGYGIKHCNAYMLVKDENGRINFSEVKKADVGKITKKKENKTKGGNKNDIAVVKPGKNVDKNTSSNETDKPVILKNLPVITKIVSYGNEKPVLVKNIIPKEGADNKGLNTQITGKPNTPTTNIPPLVPIGRKGNVPKFLKILPKTDPKQNIPQTVVKKKPIILRHPAVKRPKLNSDDDSAPSSSKIPKT